MKKISFIFLLALILTFIMPSIAFASAVDDAYENGDLIIEPHWERLPWHQNSSDVPWPGEDALDNWYENIDYDVFSYVYDVYYLGEKVDPKVIWVTSSVPTSTFCTPVWNEDTQQFEPEFDEDGIGSYRIQKFELANNGSIHAPITGVLSEENVATIPTWRLVPFDLTNSERVRIAYDETWNNNQDFVSYTGEAYPLTFWSTWEGIENPMYTIYWKDADDNEIILDKGYDYAGRAMNNVGPTANIEDQTTWAKPILLGVYEFQGKYIPTNGDFYIKDATPAITPKVQAIYKINDVVVKTTDASTEPINLDEQAPQVDNLAYWSHQSTPGYNPIVSPIEGQELNLITVYGVLNGAEGAQGEPGQDGEDGIDGQDGEPGPQGDKGDKGDTGEKGDKGDIGEAGPAGANGKDGKDGIIVNTSTKDNKDFSSGGKTKSPQTGDNIYLLPVCVTITLLAILWIIIAGIKIRQNKKNNI